MEGTIQILMIYPNQALSKNGQMTRDKYDKFNKTNKCLVFFYFHFPFIISVNNLSETLTLTMFTKIVLLL